MTITLVKCDICKKQHIPRIFIEIDNPRAKERYLCSTDCLKKHQWFGRKKCMISGLTDDESKAMFGINTTKMSDL